MQNVIGWHCFTGAQLGSEIYKNLVEKLCEPRMTDFFQALIVGGLIWFAWPAPIPVDLARIARGPMEVTVDDEAKTHVRHIYRKLDVHSQQELINLVGGDSPR